MVWDKVWETIHQTREWGKYPGEDLIRFVARSLFSIPNRSKVKILEVGFGTGANLWFLAREGFSVYGVEGSKTAHSKAQEKLDREVPGWTGKLVHGDFLKLPFDSEFFDAVIDVGAITTNSYDDSKEIYSQIHRVLKKNGKLFSRTFATGSYGDGSGQEVGHRAYIVDEGPVLDEGFNRFTDLWEVKDLIGNLELVNIEMITRTMENMKKEVKELIIIAEK